MNSGVSIVLQTMIVAHTRNTPLYKRIRRQITVVGEVGDEVEVPGAEGADPPANRARYSLTLKDDSAGPGAVPAAAPSAPPQNAAAAAAAVGGASAAEPGK